MTTPAIPQQANDLATVWVDPATLKGFPGNARRGDVEKIRDSIRENGGLYTALIVQRSTGYVVIGNHTFAAAKAEGFDLVPVHFMDWDDRQARHVNLRDNKISDDATYSIDALIEQLTADDVDLALAGWTPDELDELIAPPEEDPEDDVDPVKSLDGLGVLIMARSPEHQDVIIAELDAAGYIGTPTTVKTSTKRSDDF